jgi:hypothetical protein
MGWRDVLPVHPAADLFPLMSEAELRELAKDIDGGGVGGLRMPITLIAWPESSVKVGYKSVGVALLDGRNRLDALEATGRKIKFIDDGTGTWIADGEDDRAIITVRFVGCPDDPYGRVLSLNIHRRHLSAEQRRDLIAGEIVAKPTAEQKVYDSPQEAHKEKESRFTHVMEAMEAQAEVVALALRTDEIALSGVSEKDAKRGLAFIANAEASLQQLRALIEQHLAALKTPPSDDLDIPECLRRGAA